MECARKTQKEQILESGLADETERFLLVTSPLP